MPTEAEWEFACRAGTQTRYSFGDDPAKLGENAWFAGNAGGMTHPVGTKKPNRFGLYDMHGNVFEWCWDRYDDKFSGSRSPADDPTGSVEDPYRVDRGGGWNIPPRFARLTERRRRPPEFRNSALGFRVALSQSDR